jgi:hypothetical protein
MKKKILGIITCIMIVASGIALIGPTVAHWDEEQGDTHKMHWAQTPDTSDTGVAVDMPPLQRRGDDFMCNESGFVNDIHIWGAFYNDNPYPHSRMDFWIGIYSDLNRFSIPNPTPWLPYSRPGDLLWAKRVNFGEYTVDEITYPDQMDWYYLNPINVTQDSHTKVFQYNFHFEDEVAWRQQEGTIYWLVVAQLTEPNFGWMTTKNELNWNSNAVKPRVTDIWSPLYHLNHEPMNLAFVINGTAAPPWARFTWELDPSTLNLKSNGRSVMTKIDPPEGYDTDDIDVSTIELEDSISMSHPPEVGKIGHGKGNKKLMVKFDRSDLEDILSPGTHNLRISGQLMDGTPFMGYSNDIEVIRPGK